MSDKNRKVLFATPLPPPIGGIATWAQTMLESSIDDNWMLESFKTNLEEKEVYGHVFVKRNWLKEIGRCFYIWGGIIKKLKHDKSIEVVHVNIPANTTSMMRECVTALIAKCMKRKMLVHFHCTIPQIVKSSLQQRIFKVLCSLSDGIVVLNDKSRQYLTQLTGSSCYVVPNFVSDKIIRNEEKHVRKRIARALFVGGIIDKKGCRIIIEVAKSFPDIQFRMVGFVSNEYKGLELPPNVVLTGTKTGDALKVEFEQADVFLFLSYMLNEGFSIALTEAMAYGLPCIATDWAANHDMLGNEGGLIVPVKTVQPVVEALNKIDDETFRRTASVRNVETVRNKYSQSVVASEFSNVYSAITRKI